MLRKLDVIQYWTEPRKRNGNWVEAKFSREQFKLLDVDNIQKAWDTREGHVKRFLCKMSVDQLATGRYMKRMRFCHLTNVLDASVTMRRHFTFSNAHIRKQRH